jgi:hypothetical protein
MLLFLMVATYVGLAATSFWGAARSFAREDSFWRRHRFWVRSIASLILLYMAQAPACIYLPWAPGKPAVERLILGTDAEERLYWLEARSPVSFAWGLRWWVFIRADVSFLPIDGGLEFVPPLRFARRTKLRWDMVRSDGERWRYPGRGDALTRKGSRLPRTIGPTGSLIELFDGQPRELSAHGRNWECVPPCGAEALSWGSGVAMSRRGELVEVGEPERKKSESDRRFRQAARPLVLRFRRPGEIPATPVEAFLDLPARTETRLDFYDDEDPSHQAAGRYSLVRALDEGFVLFLTRNDGKGRCFRFDGVPPPFVPVCDFVFDLSKPVSLVSTRDLTYFSTGQEIIDAACRVRAVIDPPFASSSWVGSTLRGLRTYPFFIDRHILTRSQSFTAMLAASRATTGRAPQEWMTTMAEGAARSRWVFGGVDEAGREDEMCEERMP